MSFRKRNVAVSRSSPAENSSASSTTAAPTTTTSATPKGCRPSPVDGRLTTSTGTPSLDRLLAGHAGLAVGTSVLVQEGGTTDAAGALLRTFAAQGLVQGQRVHVVGVGEQWTRSLPGLVGPAAAPTTGEDEGELAESEAKGHDKMKIAWRYERLGQFDQQQGALAKERKIAAQGIAEENSVAKLDPFCHVFDLVKRLDLSSALKFLTFPMPESSRSSSPYAGILKALHAELAASPSSQLHRLVIPSLLSPAVYPPHAAEPQHLLRFLHEVRGLLRLYSSKLTAFISLPLELYPRSSSLVRWAELVSDGVFELTPFPHQTDDGLSQSGAATGVEEKPHGMFKIHKLPIFHERGGGSGSLKGIGDDFAYTISRRRFAIKPFSLPPAEGDTDAQKGQAEGAQTMPSKEKMEF